MIREEEERQVKKRKSLLEYYFTLEVLFEITKYFNDPKDYIYLAQVCKYFYDIMLLKENYLFKQFNEILFNNFELLLTNDLPDYLFKLKKLHINSYDEGFNELLKFTNAITLKTNILSGKYLQYVPNLEELIVDNMYDINENTFTNLKQLKILSIFSYNDLKDEWLKNLNNLTELSIPKKATFSGNCLQYFKNLRFLHIRNCSNMDDELLLNCKQLTNINVSFCNKIFGNCFKELNELKHLNINYCYNVKEDFLNNLNNLESLNIIECKNIFGHCLQNLQQLQTLNIKVHSVTQLNILIHLKNLKNLHIVFIKDKNTETTIFLLNLINLEKLYLKSFKDFIFRDEDFYNLKNLKFLKIVTKKNNLSKFTGKYTQYCTKLEKISCNVSFEVKYLDYLTNIKFLNL